MMLTFPKDAIGFVWHKTVVVIIINNNTIVHGSPKGTKQILEVVITCHSIQPDGPPTNSCFKISDKSLV